MPAAPRAPQPSRTPAAREVQAHKPHGSVLCAGSRAPQCLAEGCSHSTAPLEPGPHPPRDPKMQGCCKDEPESSFQPHSKTSPRGAPRAFLALRPGERFSCRAGWLAETLPQPRSNTVSTRGAGSGQGAGGASFKRAWGTQGAKDQQTPRISPSPPPSRPLLAPTPQRAGPEALLR